MAELTPGEEVAAKLTQEMLMHITKWVLDHPGCSAYLHHPDGSDAIVTLGGINLSPRKYNAVTQWAKLPSVGGHIPDALSVEQHIAARPLAWHDESVRDLTRGILAPPPSAVEVANLDRFADALLTHMLNRVPLVRLFSEWHQRLHGLPIYVHSITMSDMLRPSGREYNVHADDDYGFVRAQSILYERIKEYVRERIHTDVYLRGHLATLGVKVVEKDDAVDALKYAVEGKVQPC